MTHATAKLRDEILDLAGLYCEEQLDHARRERLTSLLLQHEELVALFVEYLQLHGQLVWDRGRTAVEAPPVASAEFSFLDDPGFESLSTRGQRSRRSPSSRPWRRWIIASTTVAACAMLLAAVTIVRRSGPEDVVSYAPPLDPASAQSPGPDPAPDPGVPDSSPEPQEFTEPERALALNPAFPDDDAFPLKPLDGPPESPAGPPDSPQPSQVTDRDMIAGVNELLADSWRDRGAVPAPEATPHVWVRRAYLTFAGRIPTVDETQAFLKSGPSRRNMLLVDQLLQDRRTTENLAGMWRNLLIGRTNPRAVDDRALFGFLLEQFQQNRPWIETVGKLVAAEGLSDQNGATNFLLAHLNDQATPATAVVARLFLGDQVHCTQCHSHPFAKDRTQDEFWALNAFFKQTDRRQITSAPTDSGRPRWELKDKDAADPGEMTTYESRRGVIFAVLPKFGDVTPDLKDGLSRRTALVHLLESDPEHRVARSMVNRMWAHFLGVGFTPEVDNMGAHIAPCLPELLDLLTDGFVRSGYDLRRLMTWIALSDAWQLSSLSPARNAADTADSGDVPLFSQVYPRQMGTE